MKRRLIAPGVVGAVTATSLALTPSTQAAENASPAAERAVSASPLRLHAPPRIVEGSHRGRVFTNFGARLRAQNEDFEIWAHRDDEYTQPIRAVWKRDSGDVELPAGSMSTWQGLDRFTTFQVFQHGERVRRKQATGCFNGNARKRGPDGPSTNPYPWGCPYNPYTLGSVMGLANDYTTPVFPWGGTVIRLKPGRYRVVTQIAPRWREVFGISEADGKVTSRLVVRKARRGRISTERRAARRTALQARPSTRPALEPTAEAPAAAAEGALAPEFAPDLRSLPAFGMTMNRAGTALRFGATVWNGGSGPMVVEGFRARPVAEGDEDAHMRAFQYFFDGDGNQTGYQRVGEFHWHAANHNHWHFEDFARYRLLEDVDGVPGDVAVRSTKASFCLANTDAVDYTVPNADWRPEFTDLSSACGGRRATYLREVLANGSGDTYFQFRAGQAFRVKNLPDGYYWISVEANPDNADGRNLVELDYTNNDSRRRVHVFTRKNGRRVVVPDQVGVIDEDAGFGFFRQ